MVKIITISVIIESYNNEDISRIENNIIERIKHLAKSHEIFSVEDYYKIEGSAKVIIDIETNTKIKYEEAVLMLNLISDSWIWDEAKSSACTNNKISEIFDKNINFIDIWFEDLD